MTNQNRMTESRSSSKAVAIVLGSGVGLLVYNLLLSGIQVRQFERTTLYWNFSHHILFFLIPLFATTLASGRRRAYAISSGVTRQAILSSGLLAIPLIVFPLVGHLLESSLTLKPHVARHLISTVVFQLVFVAVGEELFFRGFWQGELNLALGKPWKVGTTRFGWGVVAVVLLFGIGHLLNPFNPFQGSYELNWSGFVYSGSFAFAAGLLRERFNSLLPCIVMHASWNFYIVWFLQNVSGQLAFAVAVAIAIAVSIFFVMRSDQGCSTLANNQTGMRNG